MGETTTRPGPGRARIAASMPEATRSEGEPASLDAGLPRRVGRFELRMPIGAGAMGIVCRAHDLELRREVAVKLLRIDGRRRPGAVLRWQAEARALARLSHPNVVTVLDVGTTGGFFYIVMELVSGAALSSWIARHPPAGRDRFRRALDLLLQAGEGLAAAHRAGVIHRDFKPANVLIGDDGRVRVVDFGLARLAEGEALEPAIREVDHEPERPASRATRTGAMMGTPAYMAPEQWDGRSADARSDQYAFCVTAVEVLTGRRPIRIPDHVAEWLPADRSAVLRRVPMRLRSVLARGLSLDPDDRYPDLPTLLAAMRGLPRKFGPRQLAFTMAGGLVIVPALGLFDGSTAPCDEASLPGPRGWDDRARGELARTLRFPSSRGLVGAEARLVQRLDDYAERWSTERRALCEASRSGPSPRLDRRLACLGRAERALERFLGLVQQVEPREIDRVFAAADDLPRLDACGDEGAAELAAIDDPWTAQRVLELQSGLDTARVLHRLGRIREATEAAHDIVAKAERLPVPRLQIEAFDLLGRVQAAAGRAEAADALAQAFFGAERLEEPVLAAGAAVGLVSVFANTGRLLDARDWVRHAETAIARVDEPAAADRLRIELAEKAAQLEVWSGDTEAAAARIDAALALLAASGTADGSLEGRLAMVAGVIELSAGRDDRAFELLRRAVDAHRVAYGEGHPNTATAILNVGHALYELDRFDDAIVHYEQAAEIFAAAHGLDDVSIADCYTSIGNVMSMRGDPSEALDYHRRALAIYERFGEARELDVALVLANVAIAQRALGRPADAADATRRRIDILQRHLPAEHPELAAARGSLEGGSLEGGSL